MSSNGRQFVNKEKGNCVSLLLAKMLAYNQVVLLPCGTVNSCCKSTTSPPQKPGRSPAAPVAYKSTSAKILHPKFSRLGRAFNISSSVMPNHCETPYHIDSRLIPGTHTPLSVIIELGSVWWENDTKWVKWVLGKKYQRSNRGKTYSMCSDGFPSRRLPLHFRPS